MSKPLSAQIRTSRFQDTVVPQLCRWRRAGLKGALVTLVGVEGRSPRPVGSQLAVAETGESVGQISSGCAEGAIISEAFNCIRAHANKLIRYGAGSPYLDVTLPCGSGIDVYFDSQVTEGVLTSVCDAVEARSPITLRCDLEQHQSQTQSEFSSLGSQSSLHATSGSIFEKCYLPRTRLLIAGTGPIVNAVSEAASLLDWEVVVASPDKVLLQTLSSSCSEVHHLKSPSDATVLDVDTWTALVTLFHDHDWEPQILKTFVDGPGFYIGALGSRKTHQERCLILTESGVSEANIARIHGPVGMSLGGDTPAEIAIAIVAEIIAERQQAIR